MASGGKVPAGNPEISGGNWEKLGRLLAVSRVHQEETLNFQGKRIPGRESLGDPQWERERVRTYEDLRALFWD